MRIAFFCPHSDPLAATGEPDAGGQCVYEARVAESLARFGHEVRAYTRLREGRPARSEIAPGAIVYRCPMGPPGFLRKEDMGPYLPEFVERVLADQRAWLETADLFHGHYWDGGAVALTAGLALGRPVMFTSHSLGLLKRDHVPDPTPDGSQFRYPLRIRAERKILAAADAVVALSRHERETLTGRYGADARKIHIVPGGVDTGAFRPAADKTALRKSLGFEADFLLFSAGRLDPRKGFLELLAVVPPVVQRIEALGRRVLFLLPGGPPEPSAEERRYGAALREKAERLGMGRAIHWFPRLTDQQMKLYYSAADLFLCPSPYEPFGLVLVEAFASGTPVVATERGGPAEIVTPGVDGELVPPEDSRAFAGKILEILLAPAENRRRMNEAALRKAHDRYGWTAVAAALAEVYREIPGREAGSGPPPC